MFNISRLLKRDPESAIKAAYENLQYQQATLRMEVANWISREKDIEMSMCQRLKQPTSPPSTAPVHNDQHESRLSAIREETTFRRRLLTEAESQIQSLYVLKKWTIPIMLSFDYAGTDICRQYSQLTQSLGRSIGEYCKGVKGRSDTLELNLELQRRFLDSENSLDCLRQVVMERIRTGIQTSFHTPASATVVKKLTKLRESLESRLQVSTRQAHTWYSRAQMATQQNSEVLTQQALERKKPHDRDVEEIRALLALIDDACAAATPANKEQQNK